MKKKAKAKKNGMFLELEGKLYIVERKNGKETREELDSETMLQALLTIITKAIESYT